MPSEPSGPKDPGSAQPDDTEMRVQMKRWLDNWKRVGPILEASRVEGLRRLTEDEAARIARDLLWPMVPPGGGDDAEGIAPMKDALRRLARAS